MTYLHDKILQFAALAVKAGWEWCGVQEAFPIGGAHPALVIKRGASSHYIPFDPNDFDPIKTATQYLAPRRKS